MLQDEPTPSTVALPTALPPTMAEVEMTVPPPETVSDPPRVSPTFSADCVISVLPAPMIRPPLKGPPLCTLSDEPIASVPPVQLKCPTFPCVSNVPTDRLPPLLSVTCVLATSQILNVPGVLTDADPLMFSVAPLPDAEALPST